MLPAAFFFSLLTDTPVQLSHRRYNAYVRPQLETIVHGFYHVLRESHPFQKKIISYRSSGQKALLFLGQQYQGPSLKGAHAKILSLQKSTDSLRSEVLALSPGAPQDFLIDLLSQFSSLLEKHLYQFERSWILGQQEESFGHDFEFLKTYFKVNVPRAMMRITDTQSRPSLYPLWKNFISPIEQILSKNSPDALLKNLESLNLQWNGLNHQIRKKHQKDQDPLQKTVRLIHLRWTLVLKVILG